MSKQLLLSATLLLSSGLGLQATNIVLNGDFESTNIGVNLFQAVPAGGTALTSWTVTAPSATQGVDIISTRTGNLAYANTGFQAVDMAGTPGRAAIFQDLTTVNGQAYRITFDASSNGTPITNSLTILWGGLAIATINTPAQGTWTGFSYNVVGGVGATTRLMFQGNIDGNAGAFLDGVQVNDVIPEPSFGFLAGSALIAAGLFRRRQAKR